MPRWFIVLLQLSISRSTDGGCKETAYWHGAAGSVGNGHVRENQSGPYEWVARALAGILIRFGPLGEITGW
ncbi:MAG TPA: hypothetical protein VHK27_08160 [Gammaproteobacteria bacterium]|nr:hypothetical protein [Gammaproteobacteria bacterium]